MKFELPNGSSVHRCWSDQEQTYLVGAFQYEPHAVNFAKKLLGEMLDGGSIIVVNHFDGTVMRYVRKPDNE